MGLAERHYVPAFIGQRNRFDVADKPVWIEIGLTCFFFVVLGTNEETYLAIYAAGVFILLSLAGWAATKRLSRALRAEFSVAGLFINLGTAIAATLTSGATVLIFQERFFEGAWTYFVFIPILFGAFSYFRNKLGDPSPVKELLGEIEGSMLGGFGFGQAITGRGIAAPVTLPVNPPEVGRRPTQARVASWCETRIAFEHILVPLDGSTFAEQALPLAETLCRAYAARLTLVSAVREKENYLRLAAAQLRQEGLNVDFAIGEGSVVDATRTLLDENGIDLVVTSTRGGSGARHWLTGGVASRIVRSITQPVLLVQSDFKHTARASGLNKLLVALDGSENAEGVMPHAITLANTFQSEILLLSVPEVPEAGQFGAAVDRVETMRKEAEIETWRYLDSIVAAVHADCPAVRAIVTGSRPATAIAEVSQAEGVDLIIMATRGRGGLERLWMGSVAERVVQQTELPVYLLPVRNGWTPGQRLKAVEPPTATADLP